MQYQYFFNNQKVFLAVAWERCSEEGGANFILSVFVGFDQRRIRNEDIGEDVTKKSHQRN